MQVLKSKKRRRKVGGNKKPRKAVSINRKQLHEKFSAAPQQVQKGVLIMLNAYKF